MIKLMNKSNNSANSNKKPTIKKPLRKEIFLSGMNKENICDLK